MKIVTAFVRTSSLKQIVSSLREIGIGGITVAEIRGVGEELSLDRPYSVHNRIDIVVPDATADQVVQVILEHARTGLEGDGVIVVHPADRVIRIRTKEVLS